MKSLKPSKVKIENNKKIGVIVISKGIDEVYALLDVEAMKTICGVGEYLIANNIHGETVLCNIVDITQFNSLLSDELAQFNNVSPYSSELLRNSSGFAAKLKVVGVINEDFTIKSNITCVALLSEVYLADNDLLNSIFSNGNVELGHLTVRPSIPVAVDAKTLCSRHFAILAMTGAGKSNTVAVLTVKLHEKTKGLMNIVVIDPHGEYLEMDNTHILQPALDPSQIQIDHLYKIIGLNGGASVQKSLLNYAANTVKYYCRKEGRPVSGKEYLDKIEEKLVEWVDEFGNSGGKSVKIEYYDGVKLRIKTLKKEDEFSLNRVIEQLRMFINKNKDILRHNNGMFNIKSDKINILDLSKVDEDEMIMIVSDFLKKTLKERIKATHGQGLYIREFELPTLVIIEEAHIFASKNMNDKSSYWLNKIAKEGRKFGVGMGIVSQRPKELNPTVLSQTNTKIILKIVEPNDQNYIQMSSENIGNDLLHDLPRLGVGEAVIVGSSLQIPAMVKINKYNGKLGGTDGFEFLKNI
jgi:DNA helicase HerA-like ATPase